MMDAVKIPLLVVFLVLAIFICCSLASETYPAGPAKDLEEMFTEVRSGYCDSVDDLERIDVCRQMYIADHFALETIASQVCGKMWQQFTDLQRGSFLDVLKNTMISGIADSMQKNAEFQYHLVDEKTSLLYGSVQYEVVYGSQKMSVVYTLKRGKSRWMVYDINVDGVSMLRNLMAQVRPVLREKGFEEALLILDRLAKGKKSFSPEE